MQWTCPNCKEVLNAGSQPYAPLTCSNGHSFDFAKQGYVNLLLDNQKNSKTPGDNADMLDARRRFLDAGYYSPLVEQIQRHLQDNDEIIDLGCGEGYYIGCLLKRMPTLHAMGIDIAKIGVRKAASRYKSDQLMFAVASTYKIPSMAASATTLLSIFAPFCPEEAKRVLTTEGQLIRISPAPLHLQEIKEKLYETAAAHSKPELLPGFQIRETQRLTWEITLTGKTITEDLIPMTPLHWQGSSTVKQELGKQDLKVTFDFNFEILRPQIEPAAAEMAVEPLMPELQPDHQENSSIPPNEVGPAPASDQD